MDGEDRERAELDAQIARARALEGDKPQEDGGLQKKEGEKITLSFGAPVSTAPSLNPSMPQSDTSTAPSQPKEDQKPAISFGAIGQPSAPSTLTSTPISINPLKRPAPVNVFKAAKTAKTESDASSNVGSKKGYMSEAERLMKEDQARRAMKTAPGGYQGAGPRRTGDGGRRFVLQ